MSGSIRALRAELSRNLEYFFFEPEAISDILGLINTIPSDARRGALALLVQLSGTSGNIVPRVMPTIMRAVDALTLEDMKRWFEHAFRLLDTEGTEPAIRFLMHAEEADLRSFSEPAALRLDAAAPMLALYLRGISGADFPIMPADIPYTDGHSIFLPKSVALASEGRHIEEAMALYRLTVTFLWAQNAYGTLTPDVTTAEGHPLEALFHGFAKRRLAIDLYVLLEAARLARMVLRELPALAIKPARARALGLRAHPLDQSPVTAFVDEGYRALLGEPGHPEWERALDGYASGDGPSAELLSACYARAEATGGQYAPVERIGFVGTIRPRAVAHRAHADRERLAERIRAAIERMVRDQTIGPVPMPPGESAEAERQEGGGKLLLIEGKLVRVDDATVELLSAYGGLPGVLAEGEGTGGQAMELDLAGYEAGAVPDEAPAAGGIPYDEWDYKRAGFKKGWCTLYEQDIHPSDEPFVDGARRKYSGHILNLRRQFELMRVVPGTLRRQPEGEDIDLDAAVEAMADLNAGLSPGEGFYTRVDRRERSVAVLFLLDMSGSTKGWVNVAQRESLVMLCEALDALRDRYAIFGFSGMTRNRSEFYRIKGFSEGYTDEVRRRIAGIEPKDYTRMGPAIRHSLTLLNAVEARTRLLIVLSDGRPEDYDAYKGDHGIEDTRHALIEARIAGVHPFCITIDREAPSYISRMCGERGYVMLEEVRDLPARITELYRTLTT